MNKPKSITPEQAGQIMSNLDERDRIIFWIGIETGLRIGDILQLRVCDVQSNPLDIYERKTKRRRFIRVSEELHKHLRNRYRVSLDVSSNSKLLFLSYRDNGRAINRSTYYRHLKNACRPLKIECSAHSTRKLYAMNVFKGTNSILSVQNALGHKYMTTTATYLDIDVEQMIQDWGDRT